MYTADYESALESKQSEVREMPVTCAAAASFKILQTHRHNTHTPTDGEMKHIQAVDQITTEPNAGKPEMKLPFIYQPHRGQERSQQPALLLLLMTAMMAKR